MSFFFQAEDGIRDGHVTGVQTCALPISSWCLINWSILSPIKALLVLWIPACAGMARIMTPVEPKAPVDCRSEREGRERNPAGGKRSGGGGETEYKGMQYGHRNGFYSTFN